MAQTPELEKLELKHINAWFYLMVNKIEVFWLKIQLFS
jgi:hypothetical protein